MITKMENGMLVQNNTPRESFKGGYLNSLASNIGKLGRYIFTVEETPSWTGALLKTGLGFMGLISIDKIYMENSKIKTHFMVDPAGQWISTGLFMNGIRETCSLIYSQVVGQPVQKKDTKSKNATLQRSKDVARLLKLSKLILFSSFSLHCLYHYDTLGNISFFSSHNHHVNYGFSSFSSSKSDYSLKYVQIAICTSNLVLNILEIKSFTTDRFLTNNPQSEIVNIVVFASFITQMGVLSIEGQKFHECFYKPYLKIIDKETDSLFERNKITSLYDLKAMGDFTNQKTFNEIDNIAQSCMPPGKKGPEILREYLRSLRMDSITYAAEMPSFLFSNITLFSSYGMSYAKLYTMQNLILNSFLLIQENISSYWVVNPKIEKNSSVLDFKTEMPRQMTPAPSPSFEFKEDKIILPSEKELDKEDVLLRPDDLPSESPNQTREKKKTKGTPHQYRDGKEINQKESCSQSSCNLEPSDKKIREEALQHIKELRKQHPINVKIIENELNDAKKFLKGEIVSVGGSEFSLRWKIGETQLAMNYEIPHGVDKSNYKGNKLDRVLSILEIVYLFGLSEELINKYIEEYNLQNLYRLQKYFTYILLNRPRDV